MIVGRSETVEAVATVGAASPPSALAGGEPVEVAPAKLACVVKALLRGADFEIDGDEEARSFLDSDELRWTWIVRPEHSGDGLPLTLRVVAYVDAPDGGEPMAVGPDAVTVDISVEAVPESLWAKTWRMARDFLSYPLWGAIGGLIVVGGIAVTVWRRLQKKWWPEKSRRRGPRGQL